MPISVRTFLEDMEKIIGRSWRKFKRSMILKGFSVSFSQVISNCKGLRDSAFSKFEGQGSFKYIQQFLLWKCSLTGDGPANLFPLKFWRIGALFLFPALDSKSTVDLLFTKANQIAYCRPFSSWNQLGWGHQRQLIPHLTWLHTSEPLLSVSKIKVDITIRSFNYFWLLNRSTTSQIHWVEDPKSRLAAPTYPR